MTVSTEYTEDDVARLIDAAQFAAERHRDQRRKDAGATPYVNHPLTVAKTLWDVGAVRDTRVIAAAILHDVIEDTETSAAELRERFGEEVTSLVLEVTDDKSLGKAARKEAQVERAGASSAGARQLKLADKISNLTDILHSPPDGWTPERRLEYFEWAKRVVDRLRGTNAALEQRFDGIYARRGEIEVSG